MSTDGQERSSIGVYPGTKQRFDRAKPYNSMSADEFVDVLLDHWEGKR
jgi:hypothetical protein